MRQSIVFLLRAAVFFGAVFSKVYFRESCSIEYSSKTQILIASVQMALLIFAVIVYHACQYIVTEIIEGAHYAKMPDDSDLEYDLETTLEPVDNVGALRVAEPGVSSSCEPYEHQDEPVPDAALLEAIVFVNAGALRAYVRKIHITAVLMWGTFYSMDMGVYGVLYYFVQGLFVGWLVQLWCTRAVHLMTRGISVSALVYMLLCIGILAVNHPLSLPAGGSDVLAVCVMPVIFGCTWMLWVDTRTILEDSKSIFVTCTLLCGLVIATSDWGELRKMLATTRMIFVFLLVCEPLIKGLSLSVLVVSVQTQQKKTMMLVFVTTYAMASIYLGFAKQSSNILFVCSIVMTTVLCAMQLVAVIIADVRGGGREEPLHGLRGM
jgi:hypothetical protein